MSRLWIPFFGRRVLRSKGADVGLFRVSLDTRSECTVYFLCVDLEQESEEGVKRVLESDSVVASEQEQRRRRGR